MKPHQLSAARGMLRWSLRELSERTNITTDTINRIERGEITTPREATVVALRTCFEEHGIEFIQDGVRLRGDHWRVYEEPNAPVKLLDDVFHRMNGAGEMLCLGVDNSLSSPAVVLSEERIRASGVTMRSLVRHGDTNLRYPAREYRSLPEGRFINSVVIIYGDSVALTAADTKRIVALTDRQLAAFQREIFELLWQSGEAPRVGP